MTGKDLDLENLPNDDDEQWSIDFYVIFYQYLILYHLMKSNKLLSLLISLLK